MPTQPHPDAGDKQHSLAPKPAGRDGSLRRADIIAHARGLFLRHGYHETTTRMIAKEASASDALLYRYFPSKRDLFDAVIGDGLAHLDPYLRFGAPALEGLKLRETLEAAAYTCAEIVQRDDEVFRLIIQEQNLLVDDTRLADIIDELLEHFAARVDAFVETGEARECNSSAFARQFIGGIVMFSLYNAIFDSRVRDTGGRPYGVDEYLTEVVDAAERALNPAIGG